MRKTIIVITFVLITSTIVFSQNDKYSKFIKQVSVITNYEDSLKWTDLNIDYIEKTFFSDRQKIIVGIDSTKKWKFLASIVNTQTHIVGHDTLTYYKLRYIKKDLELIEIGKELVRIFNIQDSSFTFDDPMFIRCSLNFAMMSSDKQYLVVTLIHSYPFGNHTSWYHEEKYYFINT